MISNDFFNRKTGMALVCPITSTPRNFPLHVKLSGMQINGFIMVEQVKSIDYHSRGVEYIEKATTAILNEVLARFQACL